MKKQELKEILKPVVREICKQMHDELSYSERQSLALEFSASILASTINYNQNFDNFSTELSTLMAEFLVEGGKQIVDHKYDYDNGKSTGELL